MAVEVHHGLGTFKNSAQRAVRAIRRFLVHGKYCDIMRAKMATRVKSFENMVNSV